MIIPIVILAILSLAGGVIELPDNLGPVHLFSNLMKSVLPITSSTSDRTPEWLFQLLSAVVSLGGIYIAYLIFYKKSLFRGSFNNTRLTDFFLKGWGFDWIYDIAIVRPVVWLSEIDRKDFIDRLYSFIAGGAGYFNKLISRTQNGNLRWYLMVLTVGIALILIVMLSL
jgi:NADH-quinone oxidoreductase subunit L